ncbi:hypothetical protein ACVWVY_003645 [Bradyrhizobium sp. URHC0002]
MRNPDWLMIIWGVWTVILAVATVYILFYMT